MKINDLSVDTQLFTHFKDDISKLNGLKCSLYLSF